MTMPVTMQMMRFVMWCKRRQKSPNFQNLFLRETSLGILVAEFQIEDLKRKIFVCKSCVPEFNLVRIECKDCSKRFKAGCVMRKMKVPARQWGPFYPNHPYYYSATIIILIIVVISYQLDDSDAEFPFTITS